MTRRLITTGSPMEREAGYSRAVAQGGPGGEWCFVSGTTGYDYATMELPGSVEEQARNALATIATTLAEAGFAMADVVRCQYIVSERAFVARVFPILGEAFGEHPSGRDDGGGGADRRAAPRGDRGDGVQRLISAFVSATTPPPRISFAVPTYRPGAGGVRRPTKAV